MSVIIGHLSEFCFITPPVSMYVSKYDIIAQIVPTISDTMAAHRLVIRKGPQSESRFNYFNCTPCGQNSAVTRLFI